MPRQDGELRSEARLIRLTLTKLQLGLLAAGVAALLTATFSLGSLMTGREAGEQAAAPGRTTVVKLEPLPAPAQAGEAAAPDPQFYKDLTAPARPAAEAALALIRLPDGKEPPKPRIRDARPEEARPETSRRDPPAQTPAQAAPPREGESPKPAFSKDGPPRYTIQVLSVKEAGRAERSLRELLRKGIPAFIERADLGNRGVWHRVRVGRFWTRTSAERTLQELRRKAVRGASVVPM